MLVTMAYVRFMKYTETVPLSFPSCVLTHRVSQRWYVPQLPWKVQEIWGSENEVPMDCLKYNGAKPGWFGEGRSTVLIVLP
jgi:hypothetical protein